MFCQKKNVAYSFEIEKIVSYINNNLDTLIYGYKVENKKILVDENKAPVVKRIFEEYASEKFIKDIISDLTKDGFLHRGMELPPVTIIIDSHNIKDNFQKLVRTLYNNYENTNNEFFEVDCLLYLMRLTVNTFKSINTNNIMKFNKHTQFVYSYIQKNYASRFSLKKLEQSTSVSSTYLNALFKKDIGQSIYSFLTEIRIKKAQDLLAEQTMSINAIATKVGFKSLRSFEIAFAKQLGITPTDYIKRIKNKNVVLWVDHDTRAIYSDSDDHFPKN